MIRHDRTQIVARVRVHDQGEAKLVRRKVMEMVDQATRDLGHPASSTQGRSRIDRDVKLL
jgi:hypothetical protein